MAKAAVYYNENMAGIIEKTIDGKYIFSYTDEYFNNSKYPPVSLTFLKNQKRYVSNQLFPFFYGLLSEGVNKDIQCRLMKIDESDDFTRLLKTAGNDTIGAISLKELNDD